MLFFAGTVLASPQRGLECGEAGAQAVSKGQYSRAVQHYDTDAAHRRCAGQRFQLEYNAAMAAATAARDGERAERCAASERFRRILEANPPEDIRLRAHRGYHDYAIFCDAATSPPRTIVPLDTLPDPGPPTRAPTPAQLIAEGTAAASPPSLPALSVAAPPPAIDGDTLLLGAAGVTGAGAVIAYTLLWVADAERTTAQRDADATTDSALWDAAERRFDAANDRARAAGWTAYGLAGATLGLLGWWAARQLVDDDTSPSVTASEMATGGFGEGGR